MCNVYCKHIGLVFELGLETVAGYETPDTVLCKQKKEISGGGSVCRTSACSLGSVSNTGDILNSTPMQCFRDQRKNHLALFHWAVDGA
jgi:hypothetical protein